MKTVSLCLPLLALTGFAAGAATVQPAAPAALELGNFSVSLVMRVFALDVSSRVSAFRP